MYTKRSHFRRKIKHIVFLVKNLLTCDHFVKVKCLRRICDFVFSRMFMFASLELEERGTGREIYTHLLNEITFANFCSVASLHENKYQRNTKLMPAKFFTKSNQKRLLQIVGLSIVGFFVGFQCWLCFIELRREITETISYLLWCDVRDDSFTWE